MKPSGQTETAVNRDVGDRGNSKGTLSDEHERKRGTTTREQAKRINYLAFGLVTAGCRFESCPVHHSFPFWKPYFRFIC